MRIDQRGFLVIAQWLAIELGHSTAGGCEDGVPGGGIPFMSGATALVKVGVTARYEAKFK